MELEVNLSKEKKCIYAIHNFLKEGNFISEDNYDVISFCKITNKKVVTSLQNAIYVNFHELNSGFNRDTKTIRNKAFNLVQIIKIFLEEYDIKITNFIFDIDSLRYKKCSHNIILHITNKGENVLYDKNVKEIKSNKVLMLLNKIKFNKNYEVAPVLKPVNPNYYMIPSFFKNSMYGSITHNSTSFNDFKSLYPNYFK